MELLLQETRFISPMLTPYKLHQWLWKQFEKANQDNRPFLYRSEKIADKLLLTVRRTTELETSLRLTDRYLDLSENTVFQFSLKAVPVTRRGNKSLPLIGEAAEIWLSDQATKSGFKIIALTENNSFPLIFSGKNGHRVVLNETYFSGTLRVTDCVLFGEVLITGIGRHRGFGFGLLDVKEIIG